MHDETRPNPTLLDNIEGHVNSAIKNAGTYVPSGFGRLVNFPWVVLNRSYDGWTLFEDGSVLIRLERPLDDKVAEKCVFNYFNDHLFVPLSFEHKTDDVTREPRQYLRLELSADHYKLFSLPRESITFKSKKMVLAGVTETGEGGTEALHPPFSPPSSYSIWKVTPRQKTFGNLVVGVVLLLFGLFVYSVVKPPPRPPHR